MEKPFELMRDIYENGGGQLYDAEAVTQLQHGLQSAALAERSGAPSHLIVAALLHDIGHLLNGDERGAAERGEDALHESCGAAFLSRWFRDEVTEAIRHHVAAKRYLVTAEPGYAEILSPASVRSLELQGGAFSAAEAEAWYRQPGAADAVELRRWDDAAKDVAAVVPGFEAYKEHIESVLKLDRPELKET
ncbi:HD domain-containing protein [Denitrobaculum tricleocarpae]|uniref:HD domain-containing protein n=1 Tax=Denitrobaculum tricleocarpae TaxID=2591009 RepID=A0A545TG10_9PROT|nr:HD domain-containing protein [Denitrobaculum tricleocarpae]TQV76159.1 HD domain-containing protein [Denitrobaculum tricleocarpae]